ncbi:hypothetical protein F2Q65_17615 [Thiohalocapsa marina]|uniref:Uncharacterized protein n=1 Tax=Thiohalocapsa marina TaxID=424902 RepID=A0A5M8FDX2_9GAMM|nr:hypothetical protein [Thiohalocapsa marina]KAA6182594.1 hypothetical protein F2Q65_17615 [Thiohalocapsa marina]
MSALTAHAVIGIPHPYDDGIIVQATLGFYENSRPSWQLDIRNDSLMRRHLPREPRHVWIPSRPECILDEGLLMLGIYVWRFPKLRRRMREQLGLDLSAARHDLTTCDGPQLQSLCEAARAEPCDGKLALMVLGGSYLNELLPRVATWPLQVEVCTPQERRAHSQDASALAISGSRLATNHRSD